MGLVAGSRSLEYLKNHGYWSLITRFLKSGPFMFHPSMEFSWNGGTPKSSMVFGYSPILGNLHLPTYGMAIPTEWAIIQLLFAYLLDLWTTHGLSMPGINHVKQQNIPLNGTKNNQTKRCTITVYMAYLKVSKNGGTPKSSILCSDFPWKKPSSYWGTPMTMEIPTSHSPVLPFTPEQCSKSLYHSIKNWMVYFSGFPVLGLNCNPHWLVVYLPLWKYEFVNGVGMTCHIWNGT